MNFSWTRKTGTPEKINIKLEMDSNPPDNWESEIKECDFPFKYNVKMQNLPSLFAGKCHALLCREFIKGRDWFDFERFVNNEVEPNYKYLSSMLYQQGPWKGKDIFVDKEWLCKELMKKNNGFENNVYEDINRDIRRFTFNNSKVSFNKNKISKYIDVINSNNYGKTYDKSFKR
jgi:hypothetical protein